MVSTMYPRGTSTEEQSPMFFPASPTYMNRQFGVPIKSNLELGSISSQGQSAWHDRPQASRFSGLPAGARAQQERTPMLGSQSQFSPMPAATVSPPSAAPRVPNKAGAAPRVPTNRQSSFRVKPRRKKTSKQFAGQELDQFEKSHMEIQKRAAKMTAEEKKKPKLTKEQMEDPNRFKEFRTKHMEQHRTVQGQYSTGWRDVLTVIIFILGSPLMLAAGIASIFIFCLPNALLHLYVCCQKKPTPIIKSNCGWHLFTVLMFILYLPGLLFTIAFFLASYFLIHFVGFLPGLLFNVKNWENNFRLLAPYAVMDHFWLWGWTFQDYLRGIAQQQFRQGYWEFNKYLPYSYASTPFVKYAMCCNVFYHNLAESFISQWTWKIPGMSVDDCYFGMKYNISYALHDENSREDIDDDCFSAHYPFVPDKRAIPEVLGVQFAGMIQITHTEHQYHNIARSPDIKIEKGGRPVYIVRLYYWNPWHMLTAYVEANIRHSSKLEHPMWAIMGKNKLALWVYNNIDQLFFRYGPQVAEFVEREGNEEQQGQHDFADTQRLDVRKFGQKEWHQYKDIQVNAQHNAGW